MAKNILLLVFLTSITLFQACALRPVAWQPPTKPALEGALAPNAALEAAEKIDLQGWCGPEDIVFDGAGNMYCGVHKGEKDFSDGKILKISPSGAVEIFFDAGSWVAGLHFDAAGNLIALSHRQGLIRIAPDGNVSVLAAEDDQGRGFKIPNGLDLAADGSIYFSNTSHLSSYNIQYGRKLIMELQPQGGLYRYDPATKQVRTLIDGTYFGNGVVLSPDEDYLLLTETTKYRVLRHWLKGSRKGETEVLMENLPGFPNGISRRPDGTYWLGFSTRRNDALDKIHPKNGMKKLVYALPEFMQPAQEKYGMVLNINGDGEILSALYDQTGAVIPEAGAVREHAGYLYLGGDVVPYISRYKIEE